MLTGWDEYNYLMEQQIEKQADAVNKCYAELNFWRGKREEAMKRDKAMRVDVVDDMLRSLGSKDDREKRRRKDLEREKLRLSKGKPITKSVEELSLEECGKKFNMCNKKLSIAREELQNMRTKLDEELKKGDAPL